jgi:hypothetical protein
VTEFRAHRREKPLNCFQRLAMQATPTDAEWPEIESHLLPSPPREQHNVRSARLSLCRDREANHFASRAILARARRPSQ